MELYGSGFNAWGQMHFDGPPHSEGNMEDICKFTCILRGDDIEHVRAFLSHTAGRSTHHGLGFMSGGDESTQMLTQ